MGQSHAVLRTRLASPERKDIVLYCFYQRIKTRDRYYNGARRENWVGRGIFCLSCNFLISIAFLLIFYGAQRLKSALWLSIGKIVDEETIKLGVNATPQFIGALTEMVWAQIGVYILPGCIPRCWCTVLLLRF